MKKTLKKILLVSLLFLTSILSSAQAGIFSWNFSQNSIKKSISWLNKTTYSLFEKSLGSEKYFTVIKGILITTIILAFLWKKFNKQLLIEAVKRCNPVLMKLLLSCGADVNTKGFCAYSALITAIKRSPEVVKLLLENSKFKISQQDKDKALTIAIYNGDLEIVKLLLDRGVNINIQDRYGLTALMIATINKDLETMRLLLDHGVDINIQNRYDLTALMIATINKDLETVRLLLDHGGIDQSNKHKALIRATDNEDLKIMRLFLDHGGIDQWHKHAALIKAVVPFYGFPDKLDKVKLLLEKGTNIHPQCTGPLRRDKDLIKELKDSYIRREYTVLIKAVENYRCTAGLVELLLDHGAKVNEQNYEGCTALMMAIHYGNPEVVNSLLNRGAKVNKQDYEGKETLDYAQEMVKEERVSESTKERRKGILFAVKNAYKKEVSPILHQAFSAVTSSSKDFEKELPNLCVSFLTGD